MPDDRLAGRNAMQVPKERRIQWILECGCEPDIEHCGQCDGRRVAVRDMERQEQLAAYTQELTAAGYRVIPPDPKRPLRPESS